MGGQSAEDSGARAERKYTTVSIPQTLFEKIKKFIEGTGFKSVSDFVTWLLREFFVAIQSGGEDESEIKDRIIRSLKALGYI